ncbi:hypothetical protein EDB85DRAFT_1897862 [Lactarius pseudohatsudake]|nr:hypothetical protein EDB85DRAFT_1897862 [Lactarius pseudohatsudake]
MTASSIKPRQHHMRCYDNPTTFADAPAMSQTSYQALAPYHASSKRDSGSTPTTRRMVMTPAGAIQPRVKDDDKATSNDDDDDDDRRRCDATTARGKDDAVGFVDHRWDNVFK